MGTDWEKVCAYIPPQMKRLVEERIKQLGHSGISEYIRSLIREDLLKSGLVRMEKRPQQ